MEGISIEAHDSNIRVFVYPDEIPNDTADLTDCLVSLFAPLSVWRNAAVEYFRQSMHQEFKEVLDMIIGEVESLGSARDYYMKDKANYSYEMIRIFNILASDALDRSSNSNYSIKTAIEYVSRADNINGLNPFTWLIKGFFEINQGEMKRAEDHFKNIHEIALKQKQNKPEFSFISFVGLGIVSFTKEKYSLALDYFGKAITSHPNCSYTIRIAFSVCAFKLEQYERAKAAAEKAVLMNSNQPNGYVLLGLIELVFAQKDSSKKNIYRQNAFEYFLTAIKLNGNCFIALNHIVNHYFYVPQFLSDSARLSSANKIVYTDKLDLKLSINDKLVINSTLSTFISDISFSGTETIISIKDNLPDDLLKESLQIEVYAYGRAKQLLQSVTQNGTDQIKAESTYLLAKIYHIQEQYQDAIKYYNDVLNISPKFSLAAFSLGKIYFSLEKFKESESYFERVAQIHPEDKDTQAYLILVRSYVKNEIVSVDKIKEISTGFPFEIDLWLVQAKLRQKNSSDYLSALKCYEYAFALLEKNSTNVFPEIFLNMSILYLLAGNTNQSSVFIKKALLSLPSKNGSMIFQLKCYENDLFYEWSDYIASLTYDSSSDFFRVKDLSGNPIESSVLGQVGDDLLLENDVLITICNFSSESYDLIRGRSCIYMKGLNTKLCKKKISKGIFHVDYWTYIYQLARVHEELGADMAAREIYAMLLSIHPTFIDAYLRLSQISFRKGHMSDSFDWLKKALSIDSSSIEASSSLGDFYVFTSQWADAKTFHEKANNKGESRQDTRSMLSLGNLYVSNLSLNPKREESLKLAYKFYHHVLNKDHSNPYAAIGLGIVCVENKLYNVAKDIFSKVRDMSVTPYLDICIDLAHTNMAQGRFLDSIYLYQTSIKSQTYSPLMYEKMSQLHDYISTAYYQNKNFNESMACIKKSLFLNPTSLHRWFNLALSKEESAVELLNKPNRLIEDIEFAIKEFATASKIFEFLLSDRSSTLASKSASRMNKPKTLDHKAYCDDSVLKATSHLTKSLAELQRKEEIRKFQDEEHLKLIDNKIKEKHIQSLKEEQYKLENREKAIKASEKLETLIKEKWSNLPLPENKKPNRAKAKRMKSINIEYSSEEDDDESEEEDFDAERYTQENNNNNNNNNNKINYEKLESNNYDVFSDDEDFESQLGKRKNTLDEEDKNSSNSAQDYEPSSTRRRVILEEDEDE